MYRAAIPSRKRGVAGRISGDGSGVEAVEGEAGFGFGDGKGFAVGEGLVEFEDAARSSGW